MSHVEKNSNILAVSAGSALLGSTSWFFLYSAMGKEQKMFPVLLFFQKDKGEEIYELFPI